MIKAILAAALIALLAPSTSWAIHVRSLEAGIDIQTEKVAHVTGEVNAASLMKFGAEVLQTLKLDGDLVILINSPGGHTDTGQIMSNMVEAERQMHIRTVCVVTGEAASMAFNFLTHCDVRLAVQDAHLLFHKIANLYPCSEKYIGPRMTATTLRAEADELDKIDAVFDAPNAKALHMKMPEYNAHAEKETDWEAPALVKRGYLQGIAEVLK